MINLIRFILSFLAALSVVAICNTSANGDTITRQHDELSRIKSQSSSGGTAEVITFDKNTNLTSLAPTGSAPTPPAAPTGLAVTNLQPNAATYTWTDNASNETGYLLERRVEPAGAWQTFSLAENTTSTTHTDLTPSTLYRLLLTAQNASGSSTPVEITFTTPNGAILPATLNYPATGGSNTYDLAAGISWSVSSTQPWLAGAITPNGPAFTLTITASTNPDNAPRTGIVSLTSGTSTSTITVTQSANTSGNAVVTGVSATDGTLLHKVTITWNALAGYVDYTVSRSTVNDPATSVIVGGDNDTDYTDTSIQDGVQYYYWVRGFNSPAYTFSPFGPAELGHGKVPPPNDLALDTAFGTDGVIKKADWVSIYAMALQPDGKIVALARRPSTAQPPNQAVVGRFLSNGALDTSFGTGGEVLLDSTLDSVRDIAIRPDGTIVVAATKPYQAIAICLDSNGSTVPSFGTNGTASLSINNKSLQITSMKVHSDGKVILAGSILSSSPPDNWDILVMRLTAQGALDGSFNGGGFVSTTIGNAFGASTDAALDIGIQADGKIVVSGQAEAGSYGYPMAVVRYQTNGSLDSTFGSGGKLTLNLLGYRNDANGLAILADGKILITGRASNLGNQDHLAIVKLTSTGGLDPTFDSDGVLTTRYGTSFDFYGDSLLLQGDGQIVNVGYVGSGLGGYLTRFSPNGSVDETFDEDGLLMPQGGTFRLFFSDSLLQVDGSILVGGGENQYDIYGNTVGQKAVILRYTLNSSPKFTQQPQDSTILAGSSAILNSSASGNTPLTFQWYRGPSGDTSQPIAGATGSFITTGPLTSTTSYWLRATNPLGFVNSATAIIEVLVLPEIVVTDQSAIPAAELTDDQGSVNLGSLLVGTSATRTFSIHNSGTANLSRLALTVDGQNASGVVITQPSAVSLSPEGTTTFSIQFTPTALGPNTATLHIANNDADENAFDINLTGIGLPSSNANLSSFSLSNGTLLSPSFAPLTTSYTATVGINTTSLTVTPSAVQNATITVNGISVTSGSTSGNIALNVGSNTITTIVTAQDGTTLKTYTVIVMRAVPAGEVDAGFNPDVNGPVSCTAVQADGKILIGGSFTMTVGGSIQRNRIARLNADGTLDTGFDPNANNHILSMAVQEDGKILIGGFFTTVGGSARDYFARLNADGTLDSGFSPNANAVVYSIVVQAGGKILIGGEFTTLGGVTRNRIARLNADGTLDTAFNPNASHDVYCMVAQTDGKILIGGSFNTVGGLTRARIGRLNVDGTLDTSFNPFLSGTAYGIAMQADGKILVAGGFNSLAGSTRNNMGRLNPDGTLDTSFDPNVNGAILSTAVQADGKIVIGGYFTTVGGLARNRIARLNADATLDTGFNPDANQNIYSTAVQADGGILIGGAFSTVGGAARNYLARLKNHATTQTLSVPSANRIELLRGGASPETLQVTFELSTDGGTSYTSLGAGTRIQGGWELVGLTLPAGGHIRARARTTGGTYNGSSGLVEIVTTFSGLPMMPITSWRQTYFGSSANSGNGSDLNDYDKDGLVNILEYAFGLNPTQNSAGQTPQGQMVGANFVISFTQPLGVTVITYAAEWSATMMPNDWHSIPDTGTPPQQHTFSVPIVSNKQMFLRLKVTSP